MKFKIEKGVPCPPSRRDGFFPWNDLEIGDSFFVPGTDSRRFGANASYSSKRYGKKFVVRNVDGGVRVWRIA